MRTFRTLALAAAAATFLTSCATTPPTGPMGFFVTSAGSGKGADLGGLAGADAHCQKLAAATGAGNRTWRAYLSVAPTFASGNNPAVAAINAPSASARGPGTTPRACSSPAMWSTCTTATRSTKPRPWTSGAGW